MDRYVSFWCKGVKWGKGEVKGRGGWGGERLKGEGEGYGDGERNGQKGKGRGRKGKLTRRLEEAVLVDVVVVAFAEAAEAELAEFDEDDILVGGLRELSFASSWLLGFLWIYRWFKAGRFAGAVNGGDG